MTRVVPDSLVDSGTSTGDPPPSSPEGERGGSAGLAVSSGLAGLVAFSVLTGLSTTIIDERWREKRYTVQYVDT